MDFTGLYNRLSPRLRWIAKRRSNGSILTKDDELYQEMCIYLWDTYKDGIPDGINDAYIVKGCEFHILNYIRTHKEKVRLCGLEAPINENGDTLKDLLPDASEDIDRVIDRKLTFEAIMDNGFTKREKEISPLLQQGLTTREIGKRLGISHVMVVKLKKNMIKRWRSKENRPRPVSNS